LGAKAETNGICVGAFRFTVALCLVAISTGLIPQQHDHRHLDNNPRVDVPSESESSSREPGSITRRTLGIVGSASLSSLWIGGGGPSGYSARADPFNALIPTGSRIIQQKATVERAEGWATNGPPRLFTDLGTSRIGASSEESSSSRSIGPLQQSISPLASRELYYPPSFVGEWNVKATLQQKIFPFGPDFVPSRSLVDGSPRCRNERVGDSTTYVIRYAPAATSNNDGEPLAIADRGYNLVSMSRSYQQLVPVIPDSILWDPKKDPTRVTFQTEAITADMRPVGPRKAEVYLTARKTEERASETTGAGEPRSIFASAERSRTVTVGTGSVTADDLEVITEFRRIDDDTIRAVSRIAVYLTPNPNSMEGVLWQQVNGKAVAFYDYELEMERKKEQ